MVDHTLFRCVDNYEIFAFGHEGQPMLRHMQRGNILHGNGVCIRRTEKLYKTIKASTKSCETQFKYHTCLFNSRYLKPNTCVLIKLKCGLENMCNNKNVAN